MRLIFVHGWSVTHTDTYGGLPDALANKANDFNLNLDIQHIYLGKYISFHDEVSVDDIARAMDRALRDLPSNSNNQIKPFSCITHSTGGPVVRAWVDRFYGSRKLLDLPLKHLVMLAPANHGSSLAALGKTRVGRIKSWFQGVEPGQRVLDWLCLGSYGQWELNQQYLKYDYSGKGFFPFVLTGQGIDKKFYDFLNSYLVEDGSDGVVRVAGANMNYQYISLVQNTNNVIKNRPLTYELIVKGNVKKPKRVPLGVYDSYSHSGKKMGIMRSIKSDDTGSQVVTDILKCFQVKTAGDYSNMDEELGDLSSAEQANESKFCMVVFNIRDDQGNRVHQDDFDLFILAGNQYSPDLLPKGFFKDRQMNEKTGRLIYYLNADKMSEIKDGKFGLRIVARPSKGFSYYCAGEFQSDGITARNIFKANETTYIDIILQRFVDKNVFRFDSATDKSDSFKRTKPSGEALSQD
ncbi:MAG: phospholipase [Gammaproteobacteria bacterium]|nr:phospholipase [Gammaproteobacteria bacterium]